MPSTPAPPTPKLPPSANSYATPSVLSQKEKRKKTSNLTPTSALQPRKPIYDDAFDALPLTKPAAALPPSPPSPAAADDTTLAPLAPSTPTADEPTTTTAPLTLRTRSPTPTDRLAAQIGHARLFAYAQACVAEDAVNSAMARAFALEHAFTSTIASLAPPRESGEKLMPGLIYVLVAGMAGSIVARNRNVLLRGAAPLALGLGAAWAVIPVTMGNVGGLVWEYEKKVPALAEAHVKTREGVERGVYMAKVHAELAQRKVYEGVRDARELMEGWVRKGK